MFPAPPSRWVNGGLTVGASNNTLRDHLCLALHAWQAAEVWGNVLWPQCSVRAPACPGELIGPLQVPAHCLPLLTSPFGNGISFPLPHARRHHAADRAQRKGQQEIGTSFSIPEE